MMDRFRLEINREVDREFDEPDFKPLKALSPQTVEFTLKLIDRGKDAIVFHGSSIDVYQDGYKSLLALVDLANRAAQNLSR